MTIAALARSDEPASGHALATGADAVIRTLADLGLTTVFGYPGGTIMPIYDALARHNSVRHVLVRHEQGAAHAAEGYARVTRRPAVCFATSGPGATNLITGLTDAMMDSTPMVCITGQVPSPALGTEAFQEADIIGMTLSCTKWNCQVTNPEAIAEAIRYGAEVAVQGRPGPVLIEITKDAQINALGDEYEFPVLKPIDSTATTETLPVNESLGDPNLLAAANLLNGAERPLILAGHGVQISGAEQILIDLAELAQIPVACTLLGLSIIDSEHPLNVGMLGMHGNLAPNLLTNDADVILAVGMRFDDRVTGRIDSYAPDARIIHIEVDAGQIGKCVPTEVALVGDAQAMLSALKPLVARSERADWLSRFDRLERKEFSELSRSELYPSGEQLRMAEVIRELGERTDDDTIMVGDVGQHQMVLARYYQFRKSGTHICSGGLGTMGFALPAAIGAAVASPNSRVIAVAGDGGFQMNLQELGTIMQERIALKIIILNNSFLGMVRQWQELFFESRYSSVAMQNPDFSAICGGYGIAAETVTARMDLSEALTRMLDHDGAYLLNIVVEREENVFPMVPAGAGIAEIRIS